jgi:hypothetical protein
MKQYVASLEKIKLHAILHNITDWQDVMSCFSCARSENCRIKNEHSSKKVSTFYCSARGGGDMRLAGNISWNTFMLEWRGDLDENYVFSICKKWKQRV